jgi:hypothetical protein
MTTKMKKKTIGNHLWSWMDGRCYNAELPVTDTVALLSGNQNSAHRCAISNTAFFLGY